MEYFTRYVDIIIMTYLTGLILSSMLYVPYRVARHKLKDTSLKFAVGLCFFWPISLPLGLLWSMVRYLLIFPIVTAFRFFVKSFTLPDKKETIEDKGVLPMEERETLPFKIDPKLMSLLSEANEKKKLHGSRA